MFQNCSKNIDKFIIDPIVCLIHSVYKTADGPVQRLPLLVAWKRLYFEIVFSFKIVVPIFAHIACSCMFMWAQKVVHGLSWVPDQMCVGYYMGPFHTPTAEGARHLHTIPPRPSSPAHARAARAQCAFYRCCPPRRGVSVARVSRNRPWARLLCFSWACSFFVFKIMIFLKLINLLLIY